MERLLLVDGSNLLFQMFFGMPSRIYGKEGLPIWGVLGFVGALRKMIRRVEPTHVAVLFDGEHENGRSALDPDYKANRTDYSEAPEEETPFVQLPYIYAALELMGISHRETADCEVDDWMAGYGKGYPDTEIVFSSLDSDFFQLITEKHSVLRYRGDQTVICTSSYIKEKFGIEPCRYADFKALVGDPSDNIRGAAGIGPKTAAALLLTYGGLEAILDCADTVEKPSVRRSVTESAPRLRKNYQLIHLDGKVSLPFSLEALAYADDGRTTTEVLKGIGVL